MAKKRLPKIDSKLNKRIALLLVLGATFILFGIYNKLQYQKSLSFSKNFAVVNTVKKHRYIPTAINITKLNLTLPIKQTNIKDGVWEINPDGASHLKTSGYPLEKSPIIVYAHNKKSQFGLLKELEVGDFVSVKTNKKEEFFYKVNNIQTINPSDIEVLKKIKDNQLVLYTCIGFADSKRLLVSASPI